MNPTAADKIDAKEAGRATPRESDSINTPAGLFQGKRSSKGLHQAPSKRQKRSGGNAADGSRPRSKAQQKADAKFHRLFKSRRTFEKRQQDDGRPKDPEYDSYLKEFVKEMPEVEGDIKKAEQVMVQIAEAKCEKWLDPGSPPQGDYILRDIRTPLKPIQFASLGWMIGREAPNVAGRGGILAHDMGMGKTLMVLALMMIQRTGPDKGKQNDCSTLVVVPSAAIINHWQEECMKHAPDIFPIESMGRYRDMKSQGIGELKKYKIV